MDYFVEILLLSIDSIIFGVSLSIFMNSKRIMKELKYVPVYDIDQNLEECVSKQRGKKLSYVAVKGTVKAIDAPIRSQNSPGVTCVAQRLRLIQHVSTRSRGMWISEEKLIQKIYNCVPFALQSGNTRVEILDPITSDIVDMEKIADIFTPADAGVTNHIMGYIIGVNQEGVQTTEEILREGSVVTGIGELVMSDSSSKVMRLQRPSGGAPFYVTIRPIPFLVGMLEEKTSTYWLLTFVSGCVGFFLAAVIAIRWSEDRAYRREFGVKQRHGYSH